MSIERTHNRSFEDHHLKDLATLGHRLTVAANAAFPTGQPHYREVHVLLLSWEEDNLGVINEVLELQDVFSQTYHYDVQEWRIPTVSAQSALRKRLNNFLDEFEGQDSLLIVYYGGHGDMHHESRKCVWYWLHLWDRQWGDRNDNCLCFETTAPPVGEHSFTRSLIDELRFCGRDQYGDVVSESNVPRVLLSTALLHNKLITRIKYWSPHYSSTNPEYELRKTPISVMLNNEGQRRSIELAPLRHQAHPTVGLTANSSFQPRSSVSSATLSEQQSDYDEREPPSSQSSFNESSLSEVSKDEDPKVLISVALEGDPQLHMNDLIDWLGLAPPFIKGCHVEGIYKSGSTVMLITLPIALWNLLPAHSAINFISFVDSRNLLRIPKEPSPSTPAGATHGMHPRGPEFTQQKMKYRPSATSNPREPNMASSAETNVSSVFDGLGWSPTSDTSSETQEELPLW